MKTQHVILYQAMVDRGLPLDVRRIILGMVHEDEEMARRIFYDTKVIPLEERMDMIVSFRRYLHVLVDNIVEAQKPQNYGDLFEQYRPSTNELLDLEEWEINRWEQEGVPEEDRRHIAATTARLMADQDGGDTLVLRQLEAYVDWRNGIYERAKRECRKNRRRFRAAGIDIRNYSGSSDEE